MPSKSRVLALQFSRLGALLTFLILGAGNAMAAGGGHEALPPGAEEVARPLGIPITNSMVMVWVVAGVLILAAWLATRRMQLVPGKLQNFVEWLVESLINFFTGIMGEHLARRTFWFLATAFILILFSNWAGLIPGVGTVGWELSGEGVKDHDKFRPFFRGANADLNLTMAMAMTFFLLWFYWSLTEIGPVNFIKHIFAPKGGKFRGIMLILMGGLFFFVGLIEVLSIAVRPIALMFRLYGNVFAGESMLEILMTMFPLPDWLQWLPALPFYFLELLVGFVQALVFALLCAVFTKLMCEHHEEDHGDEAHDHGDTPAEPNSAESSS
ncbi:MAG: F0F1 ATP synthase subunit A [Roseibacillus sp.]|nr:F0F1 ATP synthase subunit A [Roseibacillus sp.]